MNNDKEIVDELFAKFDLVDEAPKPSSELTQKLHIDMKRAAAGFERDALQDMKLGQAQTMSRKPANWVASIMGIAAAAVFGFWIGFSDVSENLMYGIGVGAESLELESLYDDYETLLGS